MLVFSVLTGCSDSPLPVLPADPGTTTANSVLKSSVPVKFNIRNIIKSPVKDAANPVEPKLASEIAKLFDKNNDGMIDSKEFKISAAIWVQGDSKISEIYENWDHVKNKPLAPVPSEAVSRALSLTKGDGYFFFGSVGNDEDITEDDYRRVAEGMANLLLKDSINQNGNIPVGAFKENWSGETKIVTAEVSANTLRKALTKQFFYSPEKLIGLSNKLGSNNDGNEKIRHRINRIEYDYLSWW